MDSKVTRARELAQSLFEDGIVGALKRSGEMTADDYRAKLTDIGQTLTIIVDTLREAEADAEALKEY